MKKCVATTTLLPANRWIANSINSSPAPAIVACRPKKDNLAPLKKEQAETIKTWIEQGAKLDGGIDSKADLVKELRMRWKPPVPKAAYDKPVIVNSMAFTPDNKQLVVSGHHELTVWEVATGKLLKRIYTRAERAMAMLFLPDGKLVVAGSRPGQEGDVRVFDINAPGKVENGVTILDGVNDAKVMLKQLLDTDDSVLCLSITPDGKKLASGGCDRIVRSLGSQRGCRRCETGANHREPCRLGVRYCPRSRRQASADQQPG